MPEQFHLLIDYRDGKFEPVCAVQTRSQAAEETRILQIEAKFERSVPSLMPAQSVVAEEIGSCVNESVSPVAM